MQGCPVLRCTCGGQLYQLVSQLSVCSGNHAPGIRLEQQASLLTSPLPPHSLLLFYQCLTWLGWLTSKPQVNKCPVSFEFWVIQSITLNLPCTSQLKNKIQNRNRGVLWGCMNLCKEFCKCPGTSSAVCQSVRTVRAYQLITVAMSPCWRLPLPYVEWSLLYLEMLVQWRVGKWIIQVTEELSAFAWLEKDNGRRSKCLRLFNSSRVKTAMCIPLHKFSLKKQKALCLPFSPKSLANSM